jgi:hypothetical protein
MAISFSTFLNKYRPEYKYRSDFTRPQSLDDLVHYSAGQDYLRSVRPTQVWTVLDADGKQILVAGYYRINRMYHVVTSDDWVKDNLEVRI